jgi:hypothetical protein
MLHVLYAMAASPTVHAQHWSTRAPRLSSPAATIDETIHLPPGALEWASTLITVVSNISILVYMYIASLLSERHQLLHASISTGGE